MQLLFSVEIYLYVIDLCTAFLTINVSRVTWLERGATKDGNKGNPFGIVLQKTTVFLAMIKESQINSGSQFPCKVAFATSFSSFIWLKQKKFKPANFQFQFI